MSDEKKLFLYRVHFSTSIVFASESREYGAVFREVEDAVRQEHGIRDELGEADVGAINRLTRDNVTVDEKASIPWGADTNDRTVAEMLKEENEGG